MEGPTDFVILEAVAGHLLNGREFEPVAIQPLLSDSFGATTRGGWTEVYFWCREGAKQAGGYLRDNPLFEIFDMLIIQVDADVAGKKYSDDQRITDDPGDLPCVKLPCPPCSTTTDALRKVILGWMGETDVPPKTVLCTPSKALETWLLVALYPNNRESRKAEIECLNKPDAQLQTQPLAHRLIRGGKKDITKYRDRAADVINTWPLVRRRCTEAERFSQELTAVVP